MAHTDSGLISKTLGRSSKEFISDWVAEQKKVGFREDLLRESQLLEESTEFFNLFSKAVVGHGLTNLHRATGWQMVRDFLTQLSASRGLKGFTPGETATFVFSLKKPLVRRLAESGATPEQLLESTWEVNEAIDQLGIISMEAFQKTREDVIIRQQADMLELSTPVVELWDGILALPMIGTLDSSRTQVVMETLLQRIMETGSDIAIIDITGVPTVDTLVAQHLLKTVTAARLMGAECIISGIRPQIAATIVHLGVDLGNIATKSNLADAFRLALLKTGQSVARPALSKDRV